MGNLLASGAGFVVAVFAIVAVSAGAQAVAGFGSALLAVPLLTMVTDASTAVVGTSVVGLIPTAVNALRDRAHVRWRTVGALLAWATCGLPLGLVVLHLAPDRWLTVLVGVVVLACTVVVWRPPRLPAGRGRAGLVGAVGVLTGVLTTATGTNGPPLVAALHALGLPPRALRATIAAVFVGTGTVGAAGFLLAGVVTHRAGMLALVGLPAALCGWFVGDRCFARINRQVFRRVLLGALGAGALLALTHAALG